MASPISRVSPGAAAIRTRKPSVGSLPRASAGRARPRTSCLPLARNRVSGRNSAPSSSRTMASMARTATPRSIPAPAAATAASNTLSSLRRETERAGRGNGASARHSPANSLTRVVGAGLSASASTPSFASVSSVRQLRKPPQIASPVSRVRSINTGCSPARASVIAAAAPAGPPPTISSAGFTP